MAEERVVLQDYQSLVLQTEREKFLSRLQNLRLNNLTQKQQNDLSLYSDKFTDSFVWLSYKFIGLSKKQLEEFSTNEIKILDELISRKAWPWAICQVIFAFGFPVIGWIFGNVFWYEFKSWHYIYYRQRLRKINGKKFFSFETLKYKLQQ